MSAEQVDLSKKGAEQVAPDVSNPIHSRQKGKWQRQMNQRTKMAVRQTRRCTISPPTIFIKTKCLYDMYVDTCLRKYLS
jgi:hypothetical protein